MNGASLVRRLGPVDAASIVIANVIGIGIFTAPAFVATIVPDPIAMDEFLRQFQSVSREQAVAALELARDTLLTRARPA